MAERLGRRNALIANGIINVIGAHMELFAKTLQSPELLVAGRFVLGANMGKLNKFLCEVKLEKF